MRGNKERKVIIGAVIVTLILVTLFVALQVPRRVRLLFPTEETIEQDVKKYLKKRYKQDFHVTNIIPPSYEYASYIITVYPYGKPMDEEHKATVQGWEKDGLITYYDNYALVKLIPEFKEYISEIVREEFPENKVYVSFYKEWYDGNVDKDITLKEFINNTESDWYSSLWFDICVPYNNENNDQLLEKANKIIGLCANKHLSGMCYVNVMYNKRFYNLPSTHRNGMLGKNGRDFIDLDYYIDRDGKFDKQLEVE